MMRRLDPLFGLVGTSCAMVMALAASSRAAPEVVGVSFEPPTRTVRFYHLELEVSASEAPYHVRGASVDGGEAFFITRVGGRESQMRVKRDQATVRPRKAAIRAGEPVTVAIRYPWEAGKSYEVSLTYGARRRGGELETIATTATALAAGGYAYPGWSEHRVIVLVEDEGLPRTDEPVTFFLSARGGEVGSFEKELRIARLDAKTGKTTEVPSQVLMEKSRDGLEGERRTSWEGEGRVVRTCQAAFLGDVPAHGQALYVVAYGNPSAKKPVYESDLRVRRDDDGRTWIENDYYELELHGQSGQVKGIRSRKFGRGAARSMGFSQYQLHYNPDVWIDGRAWSHTTSWDPPPNQRMTEGPIAVVTHRWGALPRVPEVEVSVTYTFFARTPYFVAESTMDVMEDIRTRAIRNEEFVFDPPDSIDHIGWKGPRGEIHYKAIEQEAGRVPGMLAVAPYDTPYACAVREASGLGAVGFMLRSYSGTRGGDPALRATSVMTFADYGWGFRYWSRLLAYPWGDYQPDRPFILNGDTFYAARMAYGLFPLGEGEQPAERLRYVDQLNDRLRSPIRMDHQGAGPW